MCIKHINKLIITHSNIYSLIYKFESLAEVIRGKVDTLLVSETKIDESFPLGQFESNRFNPTFKLNRNSNGGGIMLFVLKDIPAKVIASEIPLFSKVILMRTWNIQL